MNETSQSETVSFLSRPETYGQTQPVERIDTHISHVFLAGDWVYKLKRAVKFPYLHYSTPEKRHRFCREEVRVNRRSAPDLYDGVVSITREADGTYALDGAGDALDWVVKMRRFDQSALWDAIAETGKLTLPMVNLLADRIATFHDTADTRARTDGHSALDFVIENENDAELRRFVPAVFAADDVASLSHGCRRELQNLSELLDDRAADGRVRHCHGDMHLGNICQFEDGPVPFDAIEFNAEFSDIDVLYDLAFVLMDLCGRDLRGLATGLFNRYLSATRDYAGIAAMPLFLALRAGIRAHVTAAHAVEIEDVEERGKHERHARAFLELALASLDRRSPVLIAVGGLSGSGKSGLAHTISAAGSLAPLPGAVHLQSDVVRKRVAGVSPEQELDEAWYGEDISRQVHDRMANDAETALQAGYPVVMDATFMDPTRRTAVQLLAKRMGVAFVGLWLEAPVAELEARVAARDSDPSDADLRVLHNQLKVELGTIDWHRVDASDDRVATAQRALAIIQDRGARS